MTPETQKTTHDRRWQAIRRTFGASMLAKGLSILCTMAQVPIALHYLGREAYGFWIALLGVATLMNFVDFGLGVGLQTALTMAWAEGDLARLRRAYASGAASLAVLAAVIVVAALPIIFTSDCAATFKLSTPAMVAQARAALLVVVLFFAVGLPFNATARLAAALQLGWIHAIWIALGSVLSLGLVLLATRTGASFTLFLALACTSPLLQGLGLHYQLTRRLGWRAEWPKFLHPEEHRKMLGRSFLFSAPQLGMALVQALPPIALAMTSGPVSAAAFNILQRLFSPLSQGQLLLLAPVWPALAEAHLKGDDAWLRRGLKFSLLSTIAFGAALALVAWQAPTLIRWWIGSGSSEGDIALRWATAGWTFALMAGQPFLYFLLGVGRLRGLAVYGTFGYAAAVAGMFAGGYAAGALGVLGGASLGYATFTLAGMVVETQLALRGRADQKEIPHQSFAPP